LTVFRDTNNQIQGFINAYISDFDTIYTKEFEPFYGSNMRLNVAYSVSNILETPLPDRMLCLNNIGTTQPYASMVLFYHLLKVIA
jgi:hypothetical protein